MLRIIAVAACLCAVLLASGPARAQDAEHVKALHKARDKGLEWLSKNQAKDGSWGKTHALAVTSFACLAYLSGDAEPFDGANSKALHKGLEYLLAKQKDGIFETQGHSWIHGQGFATLALSEAYGRSLFCKVKPDMDMKKVREIVVKAVKIISENQSNSGGWWYTVGDKNQAEGSTTVVRNEDAMMTNTGGGRSDSPKRSAGTVGAGNLLVFTIGKL